MAIDKAVYTAHATSTGGRTGTTKSSDGAIALTLVTPKELGGAGLLEKESACLQCVLVGLGERA